MRHSTGYRLAARAIHRFPLPPGALRTSIKGRRGAAVRWAHWADGGRSSSPLIWVHAASVGEGLTASPVIRRLLARRPGLQVVHSYSSPSAARWPAPFARSYADYVPLDEPRHVEAVLDVVAPSLLAFARGDLWPELVARATQRNIPVVAFGASVRPGSLRLRLPTRSLYAELLERVSWIGAATPEDAARCRRMGAADSIVDMTGDPRHDEVIERIPDIAPLHSLLAWASDRPVLVAGSLEPSDESILAAAAGQVLGDVPNAGVMLVPHDPSHASLHRLRRRTTDANLDAAVWTPGEGMPRSRCVIVGARGLLFDSYALGALAYVGGGFRRNRLHAVIEPAAYALPVLVGPQWAASADASALVTAGGAIPLPAREPQLALASVWSEWLRDPTRRSSIGLLARGTVTHGAAKVTVDRLVSLMG